MFATLLHVVLFIAAIVGLLTIKQKRLRHIPNRRTHISRRSAEGTVWLQRAVNGALDMLHCALAEQRKEGEGVGADGRPSTAAHGTTTTETAAAAAAAADMSKASAAHHHGEDSGSEASADVPSDLPFLNTLRAQLEEQISALLEDKGIASFADFRIKSWGGKPPLVKAVCLSHGGGGGGSTGSGNSTCSNNNNSSFSGGGGGGVAGSGVVEASMAGQRGASTSGGGGGAPPGAGSPNNAGPLHYPSLSSSGGVYSYVSPNPLGGEGVLGGEVPYSAMSMRHRNGSGNSEEVVGGGSSSAMNNNNNSVIGRERSLAGSIGLPGRAAGGGGAATMSAMDLTSGGGPLASSASFAGNKIASDTTRSLSVLEVEAEVEYSGKLSLSLNADLPIARGRYLQLYASISDVRMLAAHVRLRLALEYEPATVESPQPQPYLQGTLWLISDPVFDVAFHTSLTQYRIRDVFLVPKLLKFFLLRFLRRRLRPASLSAAPAANVAASRHGTTRRRRPGAGVAGGSAAAAAAAGGGVAQGGGGNTGSGVSEEAAAAEGDRTGVDGSGLSFRVQLPAEMVDGGEQWWSNIARDTMSESPAPFLRTYHQ